MQVGDLVVFETAGRLGIVLEYLPHENMYNEVLVFWCSGTTSWIYHHRLTIINTGDCHEQSNNINH